MAVAPPTSVNGDVLGLAVVDANGVLVTPAAALCEEEMMAIPFEPQMNRGVQLDLHLVESLLFY